MKIIVDANMFISSLIAKEFQQLVTTNELFELISK